MSEGRQGTIPAGLQSFTPGIPTGFYLYVS
nr:MAG TPA: hypothetical protein [Inoviridae sp.]